MFLFIFENLKDNKYANTNPSNINGDLNLVSYMKIWCTYVKNAQMLPKFDISKNKTFLQDYHQSASFLDFVQGTVQIPKTSSHMFPKRTYYRSPNPWACKQFTP